MSTDSLEEHYREVNVSYGILEVLHRLRYELASLRRLQADQLKQDIWRRVNATGLLLAAAIPAIYGLLPDNTRKELWVTPLVVLALVYLCLCFFELRRQRPVPGLNQEIDSYYEPEANPRFLSLLLNSYVTRLGVVKRIRDETKDAKVHERYERQFQYYKAAMLGVIPHIEKLVKEKKLSEKRGKELMDWIPEEFRG